MGRKANDYEQIWQHEMSKLQSRINTLKKRGVDVHYSITKPDKIQKRDIEQLRKIKQSQMIKGVSNKQLQIKSVLPDNLKLNKTGKLITKKSPALSTNLSTKKTDISSAIAKDEKILRKAIINAEKETGLSSNSWSFEPDEEDKYIEIPKPTKKRTPLADVVKKAEQEAIQKRVQKVAKSIEEISVQENTETNKKKEPSAREKIAKAVEKAKERKAEKQALQEYLEENPDYDPISADREGAKIELENAAAEQELKREAKWRKENPKHHQWKAGQASEKAIKQLHEQYYGADDVNFTGYESEEQLQAKLSAAGEYTGIRSDEELYYEDKYTGTRYRLDDSRIFQRDATWHIKHDPNGKPLIKESLVIHRTKPLPAKELADLQADLLRQRYASLASDRGQIVSNFVDDLINAVGSQETFSAFNALAGKSNGDITFADIYEGKGGSLAVKLSRVISYLSKEYQKQGKEILKKYVQGTKKTGRTLITELDEDEEGGWEDIE